MRFLPKRLQIPHFADRLSKFATVMRKQSAQDYYQTLVSHWKSPTQIVRGATEPKTLFNAPDKLPKLDDFRQQMMSIDSMTYLPDDILTKVDRAGMAVSLEARVPLLDHRIVEFAQRIPLSLKYRDGKSKWLLREVLYRYVPRELMERPKFAFDVPY